MTALTFPTNDCLVSFLGFFRERAKNVYAQARIDVLIALGSHWNNKSKVIYPSNERVAALACISLRSVERIIGEFKKAGLIRSKRQYNTVALRTFDFKKLAVTLGGLTRVDTKVSPLDKNNRKNSIEDLIAFAMKSVFEAGKKFGYQIARDAQAKAKELGRYQRMGMASPEEEVIKGSISYLYDDFRCNNVPVTNSLAEQVRACFHSARGRIPHEDYPRFMAIAYKRMVTAGLIHPDHVPEIDPNGYLEW